MISYAGDDGGTAMRKDGTERGSMRFVIDGGHDEF